jgi:hypothetical protein
MAKKKKKKIMARLFGAISNDELHRLNRNKATINAVIQ